MELVEYGLRDRSESATACKLLLQNAIILWNYLSLSNRVLNTHDPDDRRQLIGAIGWGSVITWGHVNLKGEYDFTRSPANDPTFDFEQIKALAIN